MIIRNSCCCYYYASWKKQNQTKFLQLSFFLLSSPLFAELILYMYIYICQKDIAKFERLNKKIAKRGQGSLAKCFLFSYYFFLPHIVSLTYIYVFFIVLTCAKKISSFTILYSSTNFWLLPPGRDISSSIYRCCCLILFFPRLSARTKEKKD